MSLSSSKSSSKIKKYKDTFISKALSNKLEKVRSKIKKDNDIYISKEHKKLCYYYNKYQEFLKKSINNSSISKNKSDNNNKLLHYYEKYKEIIDKLEMIEKIINFKFITDNINFITQQHFLINYLNTRDNYIPYSYTNYTYIINYNIYIIY